MQDALTLERPQRPPHGRTGSRFAPISIIALRCEPLKCPRRHSAPVIVTPIPEEIVNAGAEDTPGQPTDPATGKVEDACLNRAATPGREADHHSIRRWIRGHAQMRRT